MPFIPRELRQYRAQDPAQQWLSQLRSGNRMTASLPLLDATGSFTERIAAPGSGGWRDIQAAGAQRRAQSGSYNMPQMSQRTPTRGTTPSQRVPSAASVISSLRPRGEGFMQEVAKGPIDSPLGGAPIGSVYPGAGTNEYLPMSRAVPSAPQDRTDVGDGDGGGFLSGVGDYLGGPGIGQAMTAAGGAMMEAAGRSGASFGGSLGTGLKGFAAERARYGASEAARQRTAQAGETTPQDLTARQNAIKARYELRGFTDPIRLQRLLAMAGDKKGYEEALGELAVMEEAEPTTLEELQEKFTWFETLTPEKKASLNYMQRNPPAAGTTINTGDTPTPTNPAEEAMATWVRDLYGMRQTIEGQTLPGLQNIEQTLAIVDHERFPEITGVLRGTAAADVAQRLRGDPELLGMIGSFERLGQTSKLPLGHNPDNHDLILL